MRSLLFVDARFYRLDKFSFGRLLTSDSVCNVWLRNETLQNVVWMRVTGALKMIRNKISSISTELPLKTDYSDIRALRLS